MSWVDTLPCPASEELYVVFWSARSTSRVKFGQSWRKFSSQTREISCATPATQKRRRPNGTRGTPEGRQGVHPTPCNAPCATPATQKRQCTLCHACHAKAAETKWHQRDARGTPGVHPTPCQCTLWDQMTPEGRQRDARAYIRPPWQSTLCHACHAKAAETKGHQRRRPNGTGRTSPWQCTLCHACHAKAAKKPNGTRGTPEGRQGVHPTPWQWVSEWVWCVCVSEWGWLSVCEWCDEWVSEWASERVSEWVCVCVSDVMWEWVSEWVWCVCEWWWWEWVSEWVWCVWESEWCWSEWVSEGVWESVREEGREGRSGYRTKNKIPHVNVGNYLTTVLLFFFLVWLRVMSTPDFNSPLGCWWLGAHRRRHKTQKPLLVLSGSMPPEAKKQKLPAPDIRV